MTAQSNMSFHQDNPGFSLHRHAISFQSAAVNSSSGTFPMRNYYGMDNSSGNLTFCDNSSIISTSSPTTTSTVNISSSLLLESVADLNNEVGLSAEWIEEEQYKLEEGLVKFKNEPSIMKYIKVAALLRDKTVRDVALRCRWMARKRRKQDESNTGRKGNYRKGKFGESSSKNNISSALMPTMAAYSTPPSQTDQNQRVKCQVLSRKAKLLLKQNFQAFAQIDNNLSSLKVQDNIDLLCRTRDNINNITVILDNMKEFSSKIQMQEFPVSIDHNLADTILPHTTPVVSSSMLTDIKPK